MVRSLLSAIGTGVFLLLSTTVVANGTTLSCDPGELAVASVFRCESKLSVTDAHGQQITVTVTPPVNGGVEIDGNKDQFTVDINLDNGSGEHTFKFRCQGDQSNGGSVRFAGQDAQTSMIVHCRDCETTGPPNQVLKIAANKVESLHLKLGGMACVDGKRMKATEQQSVDCIASIEGDQQGTQTDKIEKEGNDIVWGHARFEIGCLNVEQSCDEIVEFAIDPVDGASSCYDYTLEVNCIKGCKPSNYVGYMPSKKTSAELEGVALALGHNQNTTIIEAPTPDGDCDNLSCNWDGSVENGYCWQFEGVASPDYGAWAECYGNYSICEAHFYFTQTGYYIGQTLDVYAWEYDSDSGCPGNVLCASMGLQPGPIAFWPECSAHKFPLNCDTGGLHYIGFWGNWPGLQCGWFICADEDGGELGCPVTKFAPGIGYPTGWGPPYLVGIFQVRSLGICEWTPGPTLVQKSTWGRIKAMYK